MPNDIKSLSPDDQQRIARILQTTGLAKYSPDLPAGAQAFKGGPEAASFNPCKMACDVAQAAAIAACSSLGPILAPLCVAAATAAGDACRSAC